MANPPRPEGAVILPLRCFSLSGGVKHNSKGSPASFITENSSLPIVERGRTDCRSGGCGELICWGLRCNWVAYEPLVVTAGRTDGSGAGSCVLKSLHEGETSENNLRLPWEFFWLWCYFHKYNKASFWCGDTLMSRGIIWKYKTVKNCFLLFSLNATTRY